MCEMGDDIVIYSYRIPWLIWIQILIMFLLTLTILLSFFDFFELDSSSSSPSNDFSFSSLVGPPQICSLRTQVAQNHDVRGEVETSTGNRTRSVENNAERDGSSAKDSASVPNTKQFFHPCRYFDFARNAFLKCLGLGSGSHSSSGNEHEHEHEHED